MFLRRGHTHSDRCIELDYFRSTCTVSVTWGRARRPRMHPVLSTGSYWDHTRVLLGRRSHRRHSHRRVANLTRAPHLDSNPKNSVHLPKRFGSSDYIRSNSDFATSLGSLHSVAPTP